MFDDLRIILIDKDGEMDVIFSADDQSNKNTIHLSSNENINNIENGYELLKDSTYKKDDFADKHIFYLKQHIKEKNINIYSDTNDDLLLYYNMSKAGYITIVNSSEHTNIIVLPNIGMTKEQEDRFTDLQDFFTENMSFICAPNMHIETFRENGQTFGTLDIGKTIDGHFKDILSEVKSKGMSK